jgi:uncharacterized protein YdcH (DUF465 family)
LAERSNEAKVEAKDVQHFRYPRTSSGNNHQLAQQHSKYDAQIEQLATASFLNVEHFAQEAELKKLRLRVKDQMERMIAATSRGIQLS